jgi:hypothetical protein
MKQLFYPSICLLAFTLITSCSKETSENKDHFVIEEKFFGGQKPSSSFDSVRYESVQNRLGRPGNRITIRGMVYYVVEGDRLLDEKEYEVYLFRFRSRMNHGGEQKSQKGPALVGEIAKGDTVRWPRNSILRYSINRKSFSHIPRAYQTLVDTFAAAAKKWEGACGIRFYHDKVQDELDMDFPTDGKELSFNIAYYHMSGKYYALAFSPDDDDIQKTLKVDKSFFTACHDKKGLMAHEIGHILGFLHEPVSRERIPLCPGEIPETRIPIQIGPKDSKSVMQMICSECLGPESLKITRDDAKGAMVLYGEPKGLVQRIKSYFN